MTNEALTQIMRTYRRDLHQIPELGFDLYKTYAYLNHALTRMGYQPIRVAKTGLLVHIQGKQDDAIAFRADMDALSIKEDIDVEYKSVHEGIMHACGHDGHMAMLLGLAERLKDIDKPNQSIVLIFQPAEEGPGGAKVIVESGILERYHVKKIFGMHLYPHLKEGVIGVVDGLMMSEISEYDCTVKGLGAHGAEPDQGIDAIEATLMLIQSFKKIIANTVKDKTKAILNVGTLHAGEARNSVAESAQVTGTIRAFDHQDYMTIIQVMKESTKKIEQSYGVAITLDIKNYYPPVINDHTLYQDVQNSLTLTKYQNIHPLMVSEDFAFYQQAIPGLFMMLGTNTHTTESLHPLHSSRFNFDERVLITGVNTYLDILTTYNVLTQTIKELQSSKEKSKEFYSYY